MVVRNDNIAKAPFVSTQNCFVLVSFRINIRSEDFRFASKSKQSRFVTRLKPNREWLDSSRVTNILYTRAALNTPSGHLPSLHEFSKEFDGTDE